MAASRRVAANAKTANPDGQTILRSSGQPLAHPGANQSPNPVQQHIGVIKATNRRTSRGLGA
jgi:hypothetical protein